MPVAVLALLLAAPVDALPSFGTKIPNGESVPCPESVSGDGCTSAGFCFGLGHPSCGGFRADEDVSVDADGNRAVLLNPFGEDWKASGFQWTRELCELDSDGDGYTNGEELGDPCCLWVPGRGTDGALDSVEGFAPSHPGMADDVPPVGFAYDKAAFCGAGDNEEEEQVDENTTPEVVAEDSHYNPGETRGQFELRIKGYEIPIKTTTYVDFLFNLPDDVPDLVHVVLGEVINSQPKHLHHFVLTGCASKIEDESKIGVPVDRPPADCIIPLGGWAPGSDVFANTDLSAGVMLGRSMGIQAMQLNVHYTDGEYDDPDLETYKIATDGIRVHYTPDLRPYTTAVKPLIFIGWGPKQMVVPAQTSRYYLTRTCRVNTKCKDASDEQLGMVAAFMGVGGGGNAGGEESDALVDSESLLADPEAAIARLNAAAAGEMVANMSCATIKMFCTVGDFAPVVQQLCPATCGLCEKDEGATESLRDPGSYRVTGVNYHAHLLGTEMYTTLLRELEEEQDPAADVAVSKKKQALDTATRNNMMAKDLKSREIWYYDDQATIPMDMEYEIEVAVDDSDNSSAMDLISGVEIKPGDKIQATCVYDSTDRTEDTAFGLSTYDEMCIIGLYVTFKTPEEGAANSIEFLADLALREFSCDTDNENHTTDVWQGILNEDEDPRNIYFDRPIEESDMCTFPVADFVFAQTLTGGTRNCPKGEGGDEDVDAICYGYYPSSSSEDEFEIEFLASTIAGYTCVGGKYDDKDSNESPPITKEDCIDIGGGTEYNPYTCSDIEFWLQGEEAASLGLTDQVREYLRTEWWQPKCCSAVYANKESSEDEVFDDVSSSSALSSATALLTMVASTIMVALLY